MILGFMNGQQGAPPLAERDSQSGRITCNRGGSGWMDESDIFRGQGVVCVRASLGVCACVCVWASHTDLFGLLQASIHSCGKRRQTIGPVKISSQGHLSASHKGGNARADRAEMEGTGRKEKGGWGVRGKALITHCWFSSFSLALSPFFFSFPHCDTGGHC